jgi:hypothetical protein
MFVRVSVGVPLQVSLSLPFGEFILSSERGIPRRPAPVMTTAELNQQAHVLQKSLVTGGLLPD